MKRSKKTSRTMTKTTTNNNNNNNNMPPTLTTNRPQPALSYDPDLLQMITPNAAGIDVASEEMWVCVPADRATPNIRTFGAFTADLEALADWRSAGSRVWRWNPRGCTGFRCIKCWSNGGSQCA